MEEAAFVMYHFHWTPETVLGLEHADRRLWAEQISSINDKINQQSGALIGETPWPE